MSEEKSTLEIGGSVDVLKSSDAPSSNGGVALRDEDIERTLQDVESILGEPVRKRRGRKPKAESESAQSAPPVPGFDAAQMEGTLVEVYFQLVAVLARVPIIATPEQRDGVKPLLTYCVNKYIPGNASEHLPLIGLAFITLEIARQSRIAAQEKGGVRK